MADHGVTATCQLLIEKIVKILLYISVIFEYPKKDKQWQRNLLFKLSYCRNETVTAKRRNVQMLYENIKKLVQYGVETGLTPACEKNYTINLLLDVFKEDEYVEPEEE